MDDDAISAQLSQDKHKVTLTVTNRVLQVEFFLKLIAGEKKKGLYSRIVSLRCMRDRFNLTKLKMRVGDF